MTGEYLVFKKKDAAMRYIEANPGCGLRLFNEDYDETAGQSVRSCPRQMSSTARFLPKLEACARETTTGMSTWMKSVSSVSTPT